jgi:hypothetical protein
VELSEAGTAFIQKTIQHIAAHGSVTVLLPGPPCDPTVPPSVTVDPLDQIDVYSRSQATLAAQCPANAPTTSTSTSTTASTTTPVAGGGANGTPVSS